MKNDTPYSPNAVAVANHIILFDCVRRAMFWSIDAISISSYFSGAQYEENYVPSVSAQETNKTKSKKRFIDYVNQQFIFYERSLRRLGHFNTFHFPLDENSAHNTEWENHVKRQVENWSRMPLLRDAICTEFTSNGFNTKNHSQTVHTVR